MGQRQRVKGGIVQRRAVIGGAVGYALAEMLGVRKAAAQKVPTWNGKEWTLPVQSASDNTMHQLNAVAPEPIYETGGGGSYEDQIVASCNYWGCDPNYLINVMYCESGGDQGAVAYNPDSGNSTCGIFQIDEMWGGCSMSASQQIDFAAEHLTKGDVWWACG